MLVKVGDNANLEPISLACNTGDDGLFSNIRASTRRRLPVAVPQKPTERLAVICGGGASLAGSLESIRILQATGAKVFALNNAASFLAQHGIEAEAQIIVDSRPLNARFVLERWAREVYLASQCAPETYAQAFKSGYEVTQYHGAIDGMLAHIYRSALQSVLWPIYKRVRWPWLGKVAGVPEFIGGGLTVGLTGLCLVYTLGHRKIHLYGYDSSHAKGKSHAYAQPENAADETVTCVVDSKTFESSTTMAGQAHDFKHIYEMLEQLGAKVVVHGEGLLPTMYRCWQRERNQRIMSAVYELGLSPPTYDFLSFLVEAERYRIEKKYDRMDVVFQPGPMHGFRHDDLPPDAETRKAMLWRVCVGMARLLPSVRNVMVLGERMTITGDVFPEGYAEQTPKSHYGICFVKNGTPMLRASDYARKWIADRYTARYATITLRESSYWPERNSNRAEWNKVAWWLARNGIATVLVEDSEGATDAVSLDIDLRAALYEGAVVNLGVSNGPMSLLPFLSAKYIIFKINTESCPSTSLAFLKAHGIEPGTDYGGNGRNVWKDDTAENIIAELHEFKSNVVHIKEKTS